MERHYETIIDIYDNSGSFVCTLSVCSDAPLTDSQVCQTIQDHDFDVDSVTASHFTLEPINA